MVVQVCLEGQPMATPPDPDPLPPMPSVSPGPPPPTVAPGVVPSAAGRTGGRRTRRRFRLRTWQTVIAAVVGAVGVVAAAVIATLGGAPSPSPVPGPTTQSVDSLTVAISAVSLSPLSGGATRYTFTGTSSRAGLDDMLIFVIARNSVPVREGGTWLVSPAANVAANGDWKVTWTLARTPPQVKWIAAIYESSCSARAGEHVDCATPPTEEVPSPCPSGAVCATVPTDAATETDDAGTAASVLSRFGPDAGSVAATSASAGS